MQIESSPFIALTGYMFPPFDEWRKGAGRCDDGVRSGLKCFTSLGSYVGFTPIALTH